MEEKDDKPINPPYSLGRTDRKTTLWVDNGDKTILKTYKTALKSTMTAALHFLIGIGARCYEEKHLETIAFQEDRIRSQARIILKYLEKYGPMRKED